MSFHLLTCLDTQLGLVVEPAQVRLKPHAEDKYTWAPQPEKEHLFEEQLFEKHLSKHSIGALMKLCREVGDTFQAVAFPLSAFETSNKTTQVLTLTTPFLTHILIICRIQGRLVVLP